MLFRDRSNCAYTSMLIEFTLSTCVAVSVFRRVQFSGWRSRSYQHVVRTILAFGRVKFSGWLVRYLREYPGEYCSSLAVTPHCLYYDSFLCSHIISCPIFTCIHGYNFRQVTLIRSTRLPLVVLDSWTPPWQLPEGNGWLNTALKLNYFRLLCAGISWRNATVFGHSENWTQRKVETATPAQSAATA